MFFESIICILDDCLISVYNPKKSKYPCGIWDYKIIWPIWNILKKYGLYQKKITVISNNDCIKKGITKDDSYWSKISYITHSIRDYTNATFMDYDYSMEANWKDHYNSELLGIRSVIPDKTLFIGVNEEDENHSKLIGVDKYINVTNLLNLNETDKDKLFQRGLL